MSEPERTYDCPVCSNWEQGEYETWGAHVCYECWEFHDLDGPCLPEHDPLTCEWAIYKNATAAIYMKSIGRDTE